jgi:ABC-type amino acid transport system permease subunit
MKLKLTLKFILCLLLLLVDVMFIHSSFMKNDATSFQCYVMLLFFYLITRTITKWFGRLLFELECGR